MEKQRAAAIRLRIEELGSEYRPENEVVQKWLEGFRGALSVRAGMLDIYDFLPSAITVTDDGGADRGMTPEALIGVLIYLGERDLNKHDTNPIVSSHIASKVVELFCEEDDYLRFRIDEAVA
jgi:hypothetical protein